MIGLLRKDAYLILKNLRPTILFAIIPPLFVALQNHRFLMPILAIVVPLIFASQLSETMALDEKEKWRKNISAMPISNYSEAGSKFIVLIILTFISSCVVYLSGLSFFYIKIVSYEEVITYSILGTLYSLFYGFVTIPTTYKFGAANTKYFLMLFIFVPTLIPVLLSFLHINININLSDLFHFNIIMIGIALLLVVLSSGFVSWYSSALILKNKNQP